MIEAQNSKVVLVTPPGAIVDNAAFVTAIIDTAGFTYLVVRVVLGALDVALAALKLRESDASDMTGATDVPGADFSVDGVLPGATADNGVYAFLVDLRGRKRYIDLTMSGGDGTAGTYAVALGELSRPSGGYPATAAARGHAAELFVPTL